MNRLHLSVFFVCGICLAYICIQFSEFFKWSSRERESQNRKCYSLLPKDSQLRVVDEDHPRIYFSKTAGVIKEKGSEVEALSSMNAALEMKTEGKPDKALKLFKHANSLAPKHPDILNNYGEFLEEIQNNVILADQFYFQALMYCPNHEKALINRQRTAKLVDEMESDMLKRIDGKRDHISSIPDTDKGLQRAKKEAYFQHIHHTVGIEGNTMSLSQTRSVVETQMAISGKSILEHNEILGLDAALKYINATLVNRFGPIRVKDVLEIHRRVLGFVDPFGSGELRRTQVYVGGHIPPPPSDIPPLMREFEEWLNSEHAVRMHPIKYAALAHYKLVRIHPFDDGNGRTSRLLMNAILMQAGFPPVIILKQDRHRYYEYLEMANEGDVRPFVRFIAECTEKTLDMFLWSTQEFISRIPAIDDDSKTIKISTHQNNLTSDPNGTP
ncbi:hypothetical protein RUM44_011719 [Polyplax serrata]|uniref:Protein adenylyltransferase Fic n=1 Tax=Polyplax serrata TaxID=468196 RepID=A0ABR1AQU8_POLSC